jgi:hypothetical protein
LGSRPLPGLLLEKHVIVLVFLERRIEIDQVYAFRLHVASEHVEVVPEVEFVQPPPPFPSRA